MSQPQPPQPAPHAAVDESSPWVRRWAPLFPRGEILDLACGGGRHARLLAGLDWDILAVDRDEGALALAAGPGITTLRHDLEAPGAPWPFAVGRFAGIVVTNYLHRPLLPHLAASLAPDGVLVYETFALGNEAFGKPSNPAFLLAPGELLAFAAVHRLQVLAYEDGIVEAPRPARVQRLCAAGPAFDFRHAGLDHEMVTK
jgi:SAM-dependent methyltransferase